MIFGYKRNIPVLSICLYDCPLERVNVLKLLGVGWMQGRNFDFRGGGDTHKYF